MNTLVHTPFGAMEGVPGEGAVRFLGVPFAQKPLGDLRFRAPQPVEPWPDVRSAKGFAPDPMQDYRGLAPECFSEDCLYLNIWVPDGLTAPAPVMVWIPGGAFATGGSGALAPEGPTAYDCERIARNTGCVLVSVSYRLNVFGFLNLSEFSPRFDDNVGMKDIIAALRWVHEAIGAFGGDRDNVTLFGESAGGCAISALLLIDEAVPYFHKAIIESNCFDSFYTVEEEREICRQYLKFAGLKEENAEGLLSLPYETLFQAGRALDQYVWEHYMGRCSFCPVVDGVFLKDFPTLADFTGLGKPVLVGSNRSEGNFQAAYTWPDGEKYAPLLLQRLSKERQEALYACYPGLPERAVFGEMLTDVMYTLPKLRFAQRLSQGGNPVYVYRFDYYTAVLESLKLYACHVAELLPLFEVATPNFRPLFAGSEEVVREIGTRMHRYWGAFARSGSPSVPGLTEWKPYTEQSRSTLVIDREDRLEDDPEKEVRLRYEGLERLLI